MKKFTNKDNINVLFLIIIFLLILFSIVGFDYVNGSIVDWDSQHWIFPEYFRTLFYETGDMFPSFAFNIGSGQNIYNFSYYGFLSPIVLLSYLFYFIKMVNFMEMAMICIVVLSIILMYYWLGCKFERKYAFFGTLLFLFSGPLVFHTHRHLMFINYMPFLIMSLIGVDNYFDKNKKSLLVISVFFIIMSSYYYSVGSIICIVIYAIYKYFEINKCIKFNTFLKDGIKFVSLIFLSVMMSGVLILPTFYTILNDRSNITSSVNVLELFIPKFNLDNILYNSYTIGLTSIFIIGIIFGYFSKNKNYKFLSTIFILVIFFPIIMYLLSGFMYARGKVLIPLLPIAILMITLFFEKFKLKNNKVFIIVIIIVSIMQIVVHINNGNFILVLDILVALLSIFLSIYYRNKNLIIYFACFCALICCLVNNYSDTLVSKEDISLQHNTYNYDKLDPLLEEDENIYRVGNDIMGIKNINRVINSNYYLPSVYSSLSNQNYYNLNINLIGNEMENRISTAIMPTKNILFNTYTGTKYIITNTSVPIGYEEIDNSNVYVNENVLPIGYATSKVLSRDLYDRLEYPEKAYALVTNVIVDDIESTSYSTKVKKEEIEYEMDYTYLSIKKDESKYVIESEEEGSMILKLNKSYKNKLLFIDFDMEYSESCSVGDTSITINDVKNTLSCNEWTYHNKNYNFSYVISSNDEINELKIEFDKGKYIISNINVYSLGYINIIEYVNSVDEFLIDKEQTSGDVIFGNINVSENGYFVLSVPYEEKGFTIYVDDKLTKYQKINETYIGFQINEGYHEIKIIYTSPYLLEGMIMSIIGYMMFLPIMYSDILKRKRV